MTEAQPGSAPTRCAFVALIGAPNAGKSTLVNHLVGAKVSIVSRKVQTTRMPVRGIAMRNEAQLIFIDTPGIFAPKRRLDRAMVKSAWGGAGDADLVCLVVDARKGLDEETAAIVANLAAVKRPAFLALNKVDVTPRPSLLELAAKLQARHAFAATFMISATSGDGVEDLARAIVARAPVGPWLFPADEISDAPMRLVAAEVTREKIFDRLHQELPYHSTVETDSWTEKPDGSVRIEQTIFVERESQRKIMLGKGGQTIKAIGQAARREIAELAEKKVHLFLFVKVREHWGDDPERYRALGLERPGD